MDKIGKKLGKLHSFELFFYKYLPDLSLAGFKIASYNME